jgi:hypothetical protein
MLVYYPPQGTRCSDKSETCPVWARVGRCETDLWVRRNCLISCNIKGTCDRQQIKPEGKHIAMKKPHFCLTETH